MSKALKIDRPLFEREVEMKNLQKFSEEFELVFESDLLATSSELMLEEIAERLRKVAKEHLPDIQKVYIFGDALRNQVNDLLFEINGEYLRKATRYRWADA
jgi:hypothetical protein